MLVKYRECGNDVSTEAKACPKCGCPTDKEPWYNGFLVHLVIVLSGAAGGIGIIDGNWLYGGLILSVAIILLIVRAKLQTNDILKKFDRWEKEAAEQAKNP